MINKEIKKTLASFLFRLAFFLIEKADKLDNRLDCSEIYTAMYSIAKLGIKDE